MKLLLDTHALLWLAAESKKLSSTARKAILDLDNELLVSAASFWEIGIKVSLGKLKASGDWCDLLRREMDQNGIRWLPIQANHCARLSDLPFHHRDPFDRLLISQALCEECAVVSIDKSFDLYEAPRIW